MKHLLPIGICRLFLAAIFVVAATRAQQSQRESPVESYLQGLSSPDLLTRSRALSGLLAQNGSEVEGPYTTQARVGGLLRTHPRQAARIRTALIAALEKAGDEYEAAARSQQVSEDLAEYCNALSDAVAALRDPRAALALMRGGNLGGAADICPSAVDRIIGRIHAPEPFENSNAFAVRTLGMCLLRPAMIRANPDLQAKIKRELLADLDSPDWAVRVVAAESLAPLRDAPEVRAKLQRVAALDPYYGPDGGTNGGMAFRVRDWARTALNPPDAFSYYVTRTPDGGVCQVRPASQTDPREALFGPKTANWVRRDMCDHYDPTGHDPALCWRVEPANACSPGSQVKR